MLLSFFEFSPPGGLRLDDSNCRVLCCLRVVTLALFRQPDDFQGAEDAGMLFHVGDSTGLNDDPSSRTYPYMCAIPWSCEANHYCNSGGSQVSGSC